MPYDPPITFPPLPEKMMTQIKYLGYKRMLKIAAENNGIVFGGFVRDRYISNYFKYIYFQKNMIECNTCKKYNNKCLKKLFM